MEGIPFPLFFLHPHHNTLRGQFLQKLSTTNKTDMAAQSQQQQPDFGVVVGAINHISQSHATLATEFSRLQNIPALDNGAEILAQLVNIVERLGNIERRIKDLELRSVSEDYNSMARLTNNSLAVTAGSQIIPLRTHRNGVIDEFPATQSDIDKLNSVDMNRILESYGLPTEGGIALRRKQLKKHLGIVFTGI